MGILWAGKWDKKFKEELKNLILFILVVESIYAFLNFPTISIKSVCPKKTLLQQYLSIPNSFKTLSIDSPSEVLFLNCSQRWPIGFPQLKHLTGIIILIS